MDLTPSRDQVAAITAAANEGIPVAACARIFKFPLGVIFDILKDAKAEGTITDLPKTDWAPGSRREDHVPAMHNDAELEFNCGKSFRLTRLECAFLVALLKYKQLERARLHSIVEHQRLTRPTQPNTLEGTDIKMVDVMICKLRKKLRDADPRFLIVTMWGNGYYIETAVKTLIIAHVSGAPHEKTEGATSSAAAGSTPEEVRKAA